MGLRQLMVAGAILYGAIIGQSYAQSSHLEKHLMAKQVAEAVFNDRVLGKDTKEDVYIDTLRVLHQRTIDVGLKPFAPKPAPDVQSPEADDYLRRVTREIVHKRTGNPDNVVFGDVFRAIQDIFFDRAEVISNKEDILAILGMPSEIYRNDQVADTACRDFFYSHLRSKLRPGSPPPDGELHDKLYKAYHDEALPLFTARVESFDKNDLIAYFGEKYIRPNIVVDTEKIDLEKIKKTILDLFIAKELNDKKLTEIIEENIAPYVRLDVTNLDFNKALDDLVSYHMGETRKEHDADSQAKAVAIAREALAPFAADHPLYDGAFTGVIRVSEELLGSIGNPIIRQQFFERLLPMVNGKIGELVAKAEDAVSTLREAKGTLVGSIVYHFIPDSWKDKVPREIRDGIEGKW